MPRNRSPQIRDPARPDPERDARAPSSPPLGRAPITRASFLAAAVTIPLAACTGEPSETDGSEPARSTDQHGAGGDPRAETLAENLEAPWSLAFHEETALISERDAARVLELGDGGAVREVGTVAGVQPRGEGGLLGITVHEGHLYTYSTGRDENRIERFEIRGEPGSLTLGSPATVLAGIPAGTNHNGGRLAIGPDGMLYATTGDAGRGARAQDLDSPAGKILRLTPDGEVPADNPFSDSPVYSYGHRNVQGIAWSEDGTLYASEFGPDRRDELNVITAGGNYGWPEVEGIAAEDGFIDPVQQWEPAQASPSGIAVARGSVHIACLRGRRLIRVPVDDLASSAESLVEEFGRLRDIVLAPDGALWALTNNTDGRGDPGPADDRLLRLDLS